MKSARSGAWALVAVGALLVVVALLVAQGGLELERMGAREVALTERVETLEASVGELRREAAALRRYADWLYEWVPRHVDAAISDLEHNEGLIWAWLEEITGERR